MADTGSIRDGLGQWYMSWMDRGDPALLPGPGGNVRARVSGYRRGMRAGKLCAVSR